MSEITDRYLGSLCLIARHMNKPTKTHPERCQFCLRPLEELERFVSTPPNPDEMTDWRGLSKYEKARILDAARANAQLPLASWMDGL